MIRMRARRETEAVRSLVVPGARPPCGSAGALAFLDDASYGVAIASLVIHYLRDWVAPLRELHRVL
jgi:hypothetical protein